MRQRRSVAEFSAHNPDHPAPEFHPEYRGCWLHPWQISAFRRCYKAVPASDAGRWGVWPVPSRRAIG